MSLQRKAKLLTANTHFQIDFHVYMKKRWWFLPTGSLKSL